MKNYDAHIVETVLTSITDLSVVFDAVYIDGGKNAAPYFVMEACKFVKETFIHYKSIAGANEGKAWIEDEKMGNSLGIFLGCESNNASIGQFIKCPKTPASERIFNPLG